jgi:DNA (cytosine-5)-methyltransferase 1
LEPNQYIENLYSNTLALSEFESENIFSALIQPEKNDLDVVLQYAESQKGVLAVVITSLIYKRLNPEQDIRNHQSSIPNGYSGRTFDSRYVTPFLKKQRFPSMAESGWLTRSLEQKHPYDRQYTGAIKTNLKNAFLNILERVESGVLPELYLSYIFHALIKQRDEQSIQLARPVDISISRITHLLHNHFNDKYQSEGASRLPVLALYAAYECMMKEMRRFTNKQLLPLESHTSADSRSGRIGDIDVVDEQGEPFEGVEVKHGIPITAQLVRDAFGKFATTRVKRYYLLSTADVAPAEREAVQKVIDIIRVQHGCQVVANGLTKSINYYLRLLDNPTDFISFYVDKLETDRAIKFEHKQRWNELIIRRV